MSTDKNCLSYWYPKLETSGAPTPRTGWIRFPEWIQAMSVLDGPQGEPHEQFNRLVDSIQAMIDAFRDLNAIDGPLFLRTGQGSGKHEWKHTCHLEPSGDLKEHVARLLNWSACVDFLGLSCEVWVVREMLKTKPLSVLPLYDDFPLVREVRMFVSGGDIVCWHPYWPKGAIIDGFVRGYKEDKPDAIPHGAPEDIETIVKQAQTFSPFEQFEIGELGRKVAKAFADDGAWSVDVLDTERGWYVADMAVASRSFHYPGCDKAHIFQA